MTTERLEWLPLSKPRADDAPKPPQPEEICPHCGWPLPKGSEACPHCSQSPARPPAAAGPPVDLLPRVIETPAPPEAWFDGRPFLPDAVRWYGLRLQAEQLGASGGFTRLICLDDIAIDHYGYQLETALHVLRDMDGRALLADEVGLGKTIEAGIILKELIERDLIAGTLIIVPAPLTRQWQAEMRHKFNEDFTVLESLSQLPPPPAEGQSAAPPRGTRWIISLSRARSAAWAERLLAFEYDMLIIDEAHKLKNNRTRTYRFVNRLRKRYVLMLTATPVHNNLLELYNLITILRPGHLGTRHAFRQTFVTGKKRRRRAARRTIYSGPNVLNYLKQSKQKRAHNKFEGWPGMKLIHRFTDYDAFKRHYAAARRPPAASAVQEIDALLADDYVITDFEALECERWSRRRKVEFVCRLKHNAKKSPPADDASGQMRRHLTPRNPASLRGLLREVMVRNRRSNVGVRLPAREAAIYHLTMSGPERRLYDSVTAAIRRILSASTADRRQAGTMRLRLATLQRQLCSTPQAAASGLAALTESTPDDPTLPDLLALAQSIPEGRKVDAVRVILSQYPGKILIFTDYLASMHALHAALTAAGHETVLFHGGLSSMQRFEAVHTFERSARVMLSTRSGGEGHNLQFCHQIINFDLPWNPMRIEQRIGRIHRLGQKNTVRIFNLSLTGTIEAAILDVLARKIRMFELVIGETGMILDNLGDDRGFEAHLRDMWAGSQSESEFVQNLAALEGLLEQAQQTYSEIQSTSAELSDLLGV